MDTAYQKLLASIRAKCRQRDWFGADMHDPNTYEEILRHDPHFDMRWITTVPVDDPQRFDFLFPPATAEQRQQTEVQLGFSLPPLLALLYSSIANGGFGPGAGIRGIVGGYGSQESGTHSDDTETIIEQYQWRGQQQTVQLASYAERWTASHRLLLPYGTWPERLLSLCDLGCVQDACVDQYGQMFLVAPSQWNESYWLTQLPWTLETWLWRWVRNEEMLPIYVDVA